MTDFQDNQTCTKHRLIELTERKKCYCSVIDLLYFYKYNNENEWSELVSIVARDNLPELKSFMNAAGAYILRILDKYVNTLLHLSIMFRKQNMFDTILSGIEIGNNDINICNTVGQTCLNLAVSIESEQMVLALLRKGIEIKHSDAYECTPLHLAASRTSPNICHLLLNHGADIHAQNTYGRSALYHACQFGNEEIACMLLCYGAIAATCDHFDNLPLTIAMRRGWHQDILDILFNHTFEEGWKTDVNLTLLTVAMRVDSPLFPRLLDAVSTVIWSSDDLIELNRSVQSIKMEHFDLFMRKFPEVVMEMLCYVSDLYRGLTEKSAVKLMEFLTKLFEFDSSFNFLTFNCFDPVPIFVSLYKEGKISMETFGQSVLFLYSYGLECRMEHIIAIYDCCGCCELLKNLLYMNVLVAYEQPKPLMPYLMVDFRMSLDDLFAYARQPLREFRGVLKFFASQKLRNFFFQDVEIYERVLKLPEVPRLAELARNAAREFIINKFRVKRSREFYDVVKQLPLNQVYKDILTYQRVLYKF